MRALSPVLRCLGFYVAAPIDGFIPSITASECLCSSGPEFQSKKVDEAADRGGQPAARGKNRMHNSAWQRPIREDDFQCAGRDLIHDKVVCELRNANAVFGRLPQRIHVISGVSRLKRTADEVARRISKLPNMFGGSA